jgi:hypothetical protein
MKFVLILFYFFMSGAVVAQVKTNVQWTEQSALPAQSTVYYDRARKLTWDDFDGIPRDMGIVAAITYSGFGYKADIRSQDGKSILNIKVYCYFDKNKSWVKDGKATEYILAHEQHHFDISYIATCIFIDRIQSTVFNAGSLNTTLPVIYNECLDIMNRMQDEYDTQTKNGQSKDKQAEWDRKINSMLKQFGTSVKI